MKLRCLYYKNRLLAYADGELSHREAGRLEDHLVDCADCRTTLVRLRAGQRFAGQLPPRPAPSDQWQSIDNLIDADVAQAASLRRFRFHNTGQQQMPTGRPHGTRSWWRPPRASMVGVALAFVSLSLLILTVVINRHARSDLSASIVSTGSLDLSEFHTVSISDISSSTEPHVVAEGYVSDVRIDNEDGDFVFKLVDDVKRPQPFIVCEIISPIKITPPPVGSRVRVYGVSRYDGKTDHQWYEVHPVLDIEMVRR
jgi:anti-sigma factor RsiW